MWLRQLSPRDCQHAYEEKRWYALVERRLDGSCGIDLRALSPDHIRKLVPNHL